jgi:hypothetical protein
MIEDMFKTTRWIFLIGALIIALWWFNAEYEAVRRYYPGLTKWEYFILQNKIRIVPDDK